MKVSYFVIFLKNFFIYSNELRPVKAEIQLNGGRLRGSLLYVVLMSNMSQQRHLSQKLGALFKLEEDQTQVEVAKPVELQKM